MFKKIISLPENRYTSVACIFFAFLNRAILVFLTSNIGKDKMLQLTAAENLMAGKGYGIEKYYVGNIIIPVFDRVIEFPPGYSVIMMPFLSLFHHNLENASLAFDLVVSLALIFVIRKLCIAIGFPQFVTNICTLVAGCFQYPFIMFTPPTDTVALLLSLTGLLLWVKTVTQKVLPGLLKTFFISFVFFLPFFFRFSYLPVSLLLPALLAVEGYQNKNNLLFKKGISLFIFTSLLVGLFLLFLKTYAGYYLPDYPGATPGFFPENIVRVYPFIPASFINLDFFAQRFEQVLKIPYWTAMKILECINGLLFFVLIYAVFKFIKAAWPGKPSYPMKSFFKAMAILAFFMFLLLAYMSLTLSFLKYFQAAHIYEVRLFAFIYIFVQLFFIAWCYTRLSVKKSMAERIIIYLLGFTLLAECLHGVYFNLKTVFHYREWKSAIALNGDYQYFDDFTKSLEKTHPGYELLVASTDRHYCNQAMLNGKKGIYDVETLNKQLPAVTQKTILLVIVPEKDGEIMSNYIHRFADARIATVEGTSFYYKEIFP
jgi:hypothetical protein